MNNKQALLLLEKYLDGKASLQEEALIDKWYHNHSLPNIINKDADLTNTKHEIYGQIKAQLNSGKDSIKKPATPIYKSMFFRMAAALLILLGLSVGLNVLLNKKEVQKIVTSDTKKNELQDVAPGGNKAILTLADGSKVVLDKIDNGTVTQQGNAKIVKLQNGMLVYELGQKPMANLVTYNTITTPRGGQYQLKLSDGSKVWLNAASSVTFPTSFTGTDRTVSIKGEAYLEVAPNALMPFKVMVNGMEVKVLGTHFNVNAYEDDEQIKTSLLEGSVKITNANEVVFLKPGEQAQFNKASGKIVIKKEVNMEQVIAWKNGKFIFEGEDIHHIMKKLERWYDVEPEYQRSVTSEKFVGVISRDVNLSQILNMLEKTGVVKFSIEGKKILVK